MAEDYFGGCLQAVGNYDEAEQVHRASMEARDRTGQTQTLAKQRSRRYLAWAVFHQGRVEEAQRLYETVVEQTRAAHGGINPAVSFNSTRVVGFLGKQGDWPEIV